MADSTILPSVSAVKYFYWPSCELRRPLTASLTDTTIYWSVIPRDEDGVQLTGGFLVGVTNREGKTENMWVALATVAADGLSATVVRAIDIMGSDYTVGDADFLYAHQSGAPVFVAISPVIQSLLVQAVQGAIASGGNAFRNGDGAAGDKYYYAQNADALKPYVRYNDTTKKWEMSNDGASSFVPGTGAGAITGGDGIAVTSGDIDVDTADTTIFKGTSAGAADSNKIPKLDAAGKLDTSFITAGLLASYISDLTATAAQLNSLASGVATQTFTAYEAVTADNAVALLPVETQWYDQLTDTVVNVGSLNSLRRRAVKYIPTVSGTLTNWNIRAAEQVAGATALGNLVITIETDSAGAPSGTPLANATATISQATQRTWNTTMGTRTATFGGTVTFVAGVTYWIVYAVSATDAVNYLKFGANDTYVGNYITATSLIYNLDTAAWGTSSTTSIPFGWSNTTVVPFGYAVVPTDANFGARTWNFIGFAQSTVAAQASINIETEMATLTGLAPGATYYLSETAGAITTTPSSSGAYANNVAPSSFVYKIGQARSTTSLRVMPGQKRVPIRETDPLTATTTRQYIIWFKPEFVRVFGVGGATPGNDGGHSYGYITADGTDASVYVEQGSAGAFTAGGSTNASLFVDEDGASNGFSGAGATFTDAGFTYVYTETGTASVFAILEPVA